jgi:ADP-ribose pyrophosphatase YjhB (NUDIX family)
MDASKCRVHKLVADVAALCGGKVLLVKYKDTASYDGQRGWFLPDDYLAFEEHPNEAARRILQEQAGITANVDVLSHIESFAGGPGRAWHLVFHHKVELPRAETIRPGLNVAEARWFPVAKMPPKKEVAHGGWAIDVLREVLRR